MENKRLELVKQYINQPFKDSPSPFGHWLKGELLAAEEDSVELKFEVRFDMTNPVGLLHGGVMAGIIDECMGINFFVLNRENFYPTINLNVEYFSPVKLGESIIVKTKVIKSGKSIINIKADVLSIEEKLVAQASSNFALSSIKISF